MLPRIGKGKVRPVVCSVLLALVARATGEGALDASYWRSRDGTLGSYTFDYRLESHQLAMVPNKLPAHVEKVGRLTLTTPAIEHGWDFRRNDLVTVARQEGKCSVTGTVPEYNLDEGKADGVPVRVFYGDGWVGGLSQAPMKGSVKAGQFEIYSSSAPSLACYAPNTARLFDGWLSPFLFGNDPLSVCRLRWSSSLGKDGKIAISSKNFNDRDEVTNRMASKGPVETTYFVLPDGRLSGGVQYVDRRTNPRFLPRTTVSVQAWAKVGGYQVPSDVVVRSPRDMSGRTQSGFSEFRWRLIKAHKTEKAVQPDVPKGIRVVDWRLQQAEYEPGNTPTGQVQPAFYAWNGQPKRLSDVQDLVRKDASADGSSLVSEMLTYGGPMILVFGGVALAIRGRRGARKQ